MSGDSKFINNLRVKELFLVSFCPNLIYGNTIVFNARFAYTGKVRWQVRWGLFIHNFMPLWLFEQRNRRWKIIGHAVGGCLLILVFISDENYVRNPTNSELFNFPCTFTSVNSQETFFFLFYLLRNVIRTWTV